MDFVLRKEVSLLHFWEIGFGACSDSVNFCSSAAGDSMTLTAGSNDRGLAISDKKVVTILANTRNILSFVNS
jgi:hypothetical protein